MKEEQIFEAFSNIDSKYIEEAKIRIPKKRSKRILWSVITGLITLLLLVLAILPLLKKQNPYYAIRKIDGAYYLVSKMDQKEEVFSDIVLIIYFDSIQEMYDDIIQCNFSEYEMSSLKEALQSHKKIAIPDLDNFSQPVVPDDLRWMDSRVVWYGDSYYWFVLEHATPAICSSCQGYLPYFLAISEKDFNTYLTEEQFNFNGNAILSIEEVEDRKATAYITQSEDGLETIFLLYSITDGDKQIHFREMLSADGNIIEMYIRDGALYGYFQMKYLYNRPSVEWLSAFGLEPYEVEK